MKRTAEETGVRLTDLSSDPISKISNDPMLIADIAWALCRDQAGSSADDFQSGLDGPANSRFIEALTEAIVNFFPAGKQSWAASQLKKNEETQKKAEEEAIARMNDPKTMDHIVKAMRRKSEKEMARILESLDDTEPSNTTASN